uniref:Uncharacterized protein n=1 Tax=Amphimedon queenslandica TaxID=400682 RepID=A0A1X7UEC2_AMPQE
MLDLSTLFCDVSNVACKEEESCLLSDLNSTADSPTYSQMTVSLDSSSEMFHLHCESDIDQDFEPEVETISSVEKKPTFKLVGDNVDKFIKPRHETLDRSAKLLHYFHCFAVRDTVNIKNCTCIHDT